ncbi:MAG: hypothetical protein H0U76_21205 [Ktedonobacteraceae bacterium]|nr:hypothetical protein [Ktedonobacteraceae bacterium]
MIADVRAKVKAFLQETIEAEAIRIISVERTDVGWIARAEVAEKSQYLASIHSEYRVFDKKHYIVVLNVDLDVSSYKQVSESEIVLTGSSYDY